MPKHKDKSKPKVIVAMSGGVDSSTTAALLVKRGYQVEGVYMWLWNEIVEQRGTMRGTTRKIGSAEEHARAVAEKLGIPFKVLDFQKEFKEKVVDYFLREFAAGRTPNPCVVCNLEIKFGLLFEKAMEMGADYVATGHYVRISPSVIASEAKRSRGVPMGLFRRYAPRNDEQLHLFTAKDKTKDQSYFLYNLTQEKLAKIFFPLGGYKKAEVYRMAKKWKLPYRKGESFDICFIADKNHREFLRKYLRTKPGKIIDVSGKVLGEHRGLAFYTIGQRADIGGPGPFYIVELDTDRNFVIVTNNPHDPLLYKKSLIAENVNWVAGIAPMMQLKCSAKIRYGHAAVPCSVLSLRGREPEAISLKRHGIASLPASGRVARNDYLVEFKTSQRAVTPGQSVVFYKRNEVLGGGIIS